jgi:hypothetical protein
MSLLYKEYLDEDEAATYLGISAGVLVTWPQNFGIRLYRLPMVQKNIFKMSELERLDVEEAKKIASNLNPYPGIRRRISKRLRTPAWANKSAMAAIYAEAKRLSLETGIKYHVDHEIPLQGRLVSGLHVPENLKIIPAISNHKKLNKYTP